MQSKLITRAAAGFAACALAVSLTACGGIGGAGDIRNSKEPVPVSQAFGAKGLWFETYSEEIPGKDQQIEAILSFDGEGNVTHYSMYGPYLDNKDKIYFSDLKDLSDDEILELAKKQDKKVFDKFIEARRKGIDSAIKSENEQIKYAQSDLDEAIAVGDDEKFINKYRERVEESTARSEELKERRTEAASFEYQEPKPVPFKITMETDDSGNNAAEETISYALPLDHTSDVDTPLEMYVAEQDYTFTSLYGSESPMVYEKLYNGYYEAGLWTQVGEEFSSFTLDTPDTEGIEVD